MPFSSAPTRLIHERSWRKYEVDLSGEMISPEAVSVMPYISLARGSSKEVCPSLFSATPLESIIMRDAVTSCKQ